MKWGSREEHVQSQVSKTRKLGEASDQALRQKAGSVEVGAGHSGPSSQAKACGPCIVRGKVEALLLCLQGCVITEPNIPGAC